MSTSTAPPVSPQDPTDPPVPPGREPENEASRSLSGLAAAITAFGAVVASFADVWGLIRERVSAEGYAGYGLLAVVLVVGLIATALAYRRLLSVELPGPLGRGLAVAFAAARAGLFALGTVDEHDRRTAAAATEARETCQHAPDSRVLEPFASLPAIDRPVSQPDGSACLVEGDALGFDGGTYQLTLGPIDDATHVISTVTLRGRRRPLGHCAQLRLAPGGLIVLENGDTYTRYTATVSIGGVTDDTAQVSITIDVRRHAPGLGRPGVPECYGTGVATT
jgi:hypothetical protein